MNLANRVLKSSRYDICFCGGVASFLIGIFSLISIVEFKIITHEATSLGLVTMVFGGLICTIIGTAISEEPITKSQSGPQEDKKE